MKSQPSERSKNLKQKYENGQKILADIAMKCRRMLNEGKRTYTQIVSFLLLRWMYLVSLGISHLWRNVRVN